MDFLHVKSKVKLDKHNIKIFIIVVSHIEHNVYYVIKQNRAVHNVWVYSYNERI